MSAKKIPMRMCVACREMKPKNELCRVVKLSDGSIQIDKTNKISGRGAYICKCGDCLSRAQKSNALSRAFSTSVDADVYSRLEEELNALDK